MTGAQSTLVILLSFSPMPWTDPADPASIVGVTSRLESLDRLLRKFSYGKAWIDPVRIVGVYSGAVPGCTAPFDSGNGAAIVSYALDRADAHVDYRSVNRILIMMAPDFASSCDINPNGGFHPQIDSEDGPFSAGIVTYPAINFAIGYGGDDRVLVHEFVHTLGTGHVTTLACYDSPAQTTRVPYAYVPGVRNETPATDLCPGSYLSPIDLMGGYNNSWSNVSGPVKKQFGWLGAENVVQTRAGTFTLRPLDASATPSGTLMLEVPIPYTTNRYTVEYRTEGPFPGVYVFLAARAAPHPVTPYQLSTAPFFFQPLAFGTSSMDTAMALSIDLISFDADGATVTISSDASYATQCNDGVWNGVGYGWDSIDDADFSCQTGDGLSELAPAPACYNGVDDDGDGLTDTQDLGCFSNGVFLPQDDAE